MLSPSDAAIAERDQAIPGLQTLLDEEAFAAALQTILPERKVTRAAATYVRYKPGVNCLVGYKVTTKQDAIHVYARAFAADTWSDAVKHDDRCGPLKAGDASLPGLGIAIFIWPNDHVLKQLKHFVEAGSRIDLMQRFKPEQTEYMASTLQTLRYKPGRRFVGRLSSASGAQRLLKVYSPSDFHQARAASKAFHSHDALRLARRIGRSRRHHALLFEWLPGQPLQKLLMKPVPSLEPVAAAGAALRELHKQRPALPGKQGCVEESAALKAAVAAIHSVYPALAPRAAHLTEALIGELHRMPRRSGPIHGDFYADQVLIDGGTAVLLDLDNATYGDPYADLGSFAAHLHRGALHGRWTSERAEQALDALLDGYGCERTALAASSLDVYTAIGLVRLAIEPFRYRQPDWPDGIERLVAQAEIIVENSYAGA
jgi:hypothetical protein